MPFFWRSSTIGGHPRRQVVAFFGGLQLQVWEDLTSFRKSSAGQTSCEILDPKIWAADHDHDHHGDDDDDDDDAGDDAAGDAGDAGVGVGDDAGDDAAGDAGVCVGVGVVVVVVVGGGGGVVVQEEVLIIMNIHGNDLNM